MVHADGSDHRQGFRIHPVGGVEAPSETGLKNRDFRPPLRKTDEGHHHNEFEIAERRLPLPGHYLICRVYRFIGAREIPVRNIRPVHRYALIYPHKMRGNEAARRVAGSPECRLQKCADAAFSVRPGNVQDLPCRPLGLSQQPQELLRMLITVFSQKHAAPVQPAHGLLICHHIVFHPLRSYR